MQRVVDLLQRCGAFGKLSSSLKRYLTDTAQGAMPETPKQSHPAFAHVTARVIANNATALNGVATAARRSGISAIVNEQPIVGDAAAAGASVAESLLAARDRAEPGTVHSVIWGGETTVRLLTPVALGGRCQELALAAAQRLAAAGERAHGISVLAAGTDGRDGPTDAAGAVVDASTWEAVIEQGRDPVAALRAHESYDALAAVGALYKPGLTGTNVMDVVIGLVRA